MAPCLSLDTADATKPVDQLAPSRTLVGPGGSPDTARAPCCVHEPAGAAPRPFLGTPHENALRHPPSLAGSFSGETSCRAREVRDAQARGAGQTLVDAHHQG